MDIFLGYEVKSYFDHYLENLEASLQTKQNYKIQKITEEL